MNINKLKKLRQQIDFAEDINHLKKEIIDKLDKIILLFGHEIEADIEDLEKDVEQLQETKIPNGKAMEIVGHLVTDFGELRRHLEIEF